MEAIEVMLLHHAAAMARTMPPAFTVAVYGPAPKAYAVMASILKACDPFCEGREDVSKCHVMASAIAPLIVDPMTINTEWDIAAQLRTQALLKVTSLLRLGTHFSVVLGGSGVLGLAAGANEIVDCQVTYAGFGMLLASATTPYTSTMWWLCSQAGFLFILHKFAVLASLERLAREKVEAELTATQVRLAAVEDQMHRHPVAGAFTIVGRAAQLGRELTAKQVESIRTKL